MEIFKITLFDKRSDDKPGGQLLNPAPKPYHFEVTPTDKVKTVLDSVAKVVGTDTIRILSLYAHGYVAKDRRGHEHGGFGIQFGTGLYQSTVSAFEVLGGKFSSQIGIELVGCAVAVQDGYRDPLDNATSGGKDLCFAIARAARTAVRASSSDQKFHYGPKEGQDGGQQYTDPGPWEGDVWIFKPNGEVEKDTYYSR